MIVIFFILRFSWASLWSLRLTDENDLGKLRCSNLGEKLQQRSFHQHHYSRFYLHWGVMFLLDMPVIRIGGTSLIEVTYHEEIACYSKTKISACHFEFEDGEIVHLIGDSKVNSEFETDILPYSERDFDRNKDILKLHGFQVRMLISVLTGAYSRPPRADFVD